MSTPGREQALGQESQSLLRRLEVDPEEVALAKAELERRLTTLWQDGGVSEEEARRRARVD